SQVREALEKRKQEVCGRVLQEEDTFTSVSQSIEEGRCRLRKWGFAHKGWRALEGGLKRVYAQGRDALEASAADATTENLHEWRKQGKYLWHQLQLLEPVWPETMKELADQSHHLTQLLGDNHDLAVLRDTVTADPDSFGGDSTLETLLALIDRR